MRRIGLILMAGGLATAALARSPAREVVGFSLSNDVGFGNSVYVVGSHPDLGRFEVTNAVKLRFTAGNIWTGQVAVQAGTELTYRFLSRDDSVPQQCNPANGTVLTSDFVTNLPPQPEAPYQGKTILYLSGWTNATLGYSTNGTNFVDHPLSMVSTGRNQNEFLYRGDGFGEAGEPIQFFLKGYSNNVPSLQFDNARFGGFGQYNNDYYTKLDVFFLQDGDLFNYRPPPAVSPSRIVSTNIVSDWATNSPSVESRDIRIYLPRGYDQNTWKRYPVMYMHDGLNVFNPSGSPVSWGADSTAEREISQGRMRETIIVGVPASTFARTQEYLPPEDNEGGQGFGDLFAKFMVHNVMPTLNVHYRTLTNFNDTMTIGSSSGGLIAGYLGLASNVYGRFGAFSPAYSIAPNFMAKIDADPKQNDRIYMDISEFDITQLFSGYLQVYDLHLADGYAVNKDLLAVVGCDHAHNEFAWSNRLPRAFHFLLDVWDEPNRLAQELYPPELSMDGVGNSMVVSSAALRAFSYRLERATSLANGPWEGVATSAVEQLPWTTVTIADPDPPVTSAAYRVVAKPSP